MPLRHAKFHMNRCNESPLQGENADFWLLNKINTGSLPLRVNPADKKKERKTQNSGTLALRPDQTLSDPDQTLHGGWPTVCSYITKCHSNRLRGYGAVRGRKWPFPFTLASGLYNSLYYCTSGRDHIRKICFTPESNTGKATARFTLFFLFCNISVQLYDFVKCELNLGVYRFTCIVVYFSVLKHLVQTILCRIRHYNCINMNISAREKVAPK